MQRASVTHIKTYSEEQFAKLRRAGDLAAKVLDMLCDGVIKKGVSTLEINDICHDFIIKHGAIPAPLNYRGFPKSICTSVNHVVCHGIPSKDKILQDGDIINVDVTVILDGYYGDTSRMYIASKPKKDTQLLCLRTYEAMMLGIEAAKPGNVIRDIAIAIETYTNKFGYSVVRDFCGHGIGNIFHEEPHILHYNDKSSKYQDIEIKEGMVFTIEPMINQGVWQLQISAFDKWTATTKDKKPSAQFEHTIGITANGNEIFTKSLKGLDVPCG